MPMHTLKKTPGKLSSPSPWTLPRPLRMSHQCDAGGAGRQPETHGTAASKSRGGNTRFAAIRQAMAGFGRPAGEHHEHSGRPQPALQYEAMFCQFLSGLPKPAKAAHRHHQRGSPEGGCVAQASTCVARPWAQPPE